MYECKYMCVFTCGLIHMEVRGQFWLFPWSHLQCILFFVFLWWLFLFCFILFLLYCFLRLGFFCLGVIGWTVLAGKWSPRILLTPPPQCWHDKVCVLPHLTFTWVLGMELRSPACTTTLHGESSLQSLSIYFNFETVSFWSGILECAHFLTPTSGGSI